MKKIFFLKQLMTLLIFSAILSLSSCNYPEYEIEYSEAYPVCGEYYVYDYDAATMLPILNTDDVAIHYNVYIYNKSYNPNKDSIWIDNTEHTKDDGYEGVPFKIKNRVDLTNKTFDCGITPVVTGKNANPAKFPNKYVTISESKVIINEWPVPDSIYFKVVISDSLQVPIKTVIIAGHRKTGWEYPEYTDPM